MKCCCESNNISGILTLDRKERWGDKEFVKRVAISKLADLERIDHTCRNKIGSNINLNLPNAVGRLKIDWKQLVWMVRHGLKHKNTDSNIRATKLQSRIGYVIYQK
jgi:hypothetical protein